MDQLHGFADWLDDREKPTRPLQILRQGITRELARRANQAEDDDETTREVMLTSILTDATLQALAILSPGSTPPESLVRDARRRLRKLDRSYSIEQALQVARWARRVYSTGENRSRRSWT